MHILRNDLEIIRTRRLIVNLQQQPSHIDIRKYSLPSRSGCDRQAPGRPAVWRHRVGAIDNLLLSREFSRRARRDLVAHDMAAKTAAVAHAPLLNGQ